MLKGLDEFSRMLKEAQEALGSLDGELTNVRFDPEDPASIEAAIQEMERTIDEKVGRHANNAIVAPLVASAKEHFREAILDRAAAARAGEAEKSDGECGGEG